MSLYSKVFYKNQLVHLSRVEQLGLEPFFAKRSLRAPVLLHNIRGKERRASDSFSICNMDEVKVVMLYLQELLGDAALGLKPSDIGVIAPYRKQVEAIEKRINAMGASFSGIDVGTVENFQGQDLCDRCGCDILLQHDMAHTTRMFVYVYAYAHTCAHPVMGAHGHTPQQTHTHAHPHAHPHSQPYPHTLLCLVLHFSLSLCVPGGFLLLEPSCMLMLFTESAAQGFPVHRPQTCLVQDGTDKGNTHCVFNWLNKTRFALGCASLYRFMARIGNLASSENFVCIRRSGGRRFIAGRGHVFVAVVASPIRDGTNGDCA